MFGETLFQTKLLSRLSHKVCCLLSSPVLLRKFTNDDDDDDDKDKDDDADHDYDHRKPRTSRSHVTTALSSGLRFTVSDFPQGFVHPKHHKPTSLRETLIFRILPLINY